jgi:hypothetical protein
VLVDWDWEEGSRVTESILQKVPVDKSKAIKVRHNLDPEQRDWLWKKRGIPMFTDEKSMYTWAEDVHQEKRAKYAFELAKCAVWPNKGKGEDEGEWAGWNRGKGQDSEKWTWGKGKKNETAGGSWEGKKGDEKWTW